MGDQVVKALDLDFVRSQFPAFSDPRERHWRHFENAGGSYACAQVIERLGRYYRANKVQPYYYSEASREAGELMDAARARFAAWLGVAAEEVHFGPSTTQNTYVLAQALRQRLEPGDEIVVTNLDHEANIGPWRRLADDGLVIRQWSIDPETGELDPRDLDRLLGSRTRAVAFTHCSNVVGGILPVRHIVEQVHAAGAWAIVDGVSYCGHGLPDVAALGADAYLFSLYKVYGTHQGVMVLRSALNDALPNQGHYFNAAKPTARFTPAGPDHAQIAAANGVIDYFEAVQQHHAAGACEPLQAARVVRELFQHHERSLLQPLLDFARSCPGVRLLGRDSVQDRAPTVGLALQGRDPHEVARALAEQRLFVGAGHFYAARCLEALGLEAEPGILRLSFVHYTRPEEVQALLDALERELRP